MLESEVKWNQLSEPNPYPKCVFVVILIVFDEKIGDKMFFYHLFFHQIL